jgi:hypothetical protein
MLAVALPNRDAASPATARIVYVVSDSGSVTSRVARPLTSVSIDPSQKASGRKSCARVDFAAAAALVSALWASGHAG